jgi:hypothetical protein
MKFHLFNNYSRWRRIRLGHAIHVTNQNLATLEDLLPGGANYRPAKHLRLQCGRRVRQAHGDRMVTISL